MRSCSTSIGHFQSFQFCFHVMYTTRLSVEASPATEHQRLERRLTPWNPRDAIPASSTSFPQEGQLLQRCQTGIGCWRSQSANAGFRKHAARVSSCTASWYCAPACPGPIRLVSFRQAECLIVSYSASLCNIAELNGLKPGKALRTGQGSTQSQAPGVTHVSCNPNLRVVSISAHVHGPTM